MARRDAAGHELLPQFSIDGGVEAFVLGALTILSMGATLSVNRAQHTYEFSRIVINFATGASA